ncbi:MAG TPA: alpha/beta hydrolase [Solirubrobacteraceae bacterium]|nr:alpha/beta hydrolase [Solirubrobacteraceae bacterium]
MAPARAQIAAVVRNALLRPGPDPTYTDGDDAAWMDVDWPSLQRTLDVGGQRVNVLDTGGSGPALLFVHGWTSNWQIFLLNIAAFMGTHRVLSLDLPGFGASELPPEPLSIRGYARTVDAVCDALDVERVSVVGSSMGGFIGAELALSFATRVDRLVLVAAAGLSTEHLPRGLSLTAARVVAAGMPFATSFQSPVVRRPRLRRAAMQWVLRYPERLSVPLAQELVLSFGKPGFVAGLRAIMDYSYRDRLPEIDIPVLVVWGRNDLLVPVGDAFAYAELIGENARVEVFEDTGHAPMLERPSRFNSLLRGFLAGEAAPEADVAGVTPG